MRLAISTSPSRVSSGTVPISRRYMRTGSLVFSSVPGVRSSSTSSPSSSSKSFSAPNFGASSRSMPWRADGRHQIVDVVWRSADILRQHVIDVAVGQVALLLACIDQVSDVVFEFVVDGQMIPSLQHDQVSTPGRAPVRSSSRMQQHLDAQTCAFADTDSRSPHQKSGRNSRSEQDLRASGFAWSPASRSSYVGQRGAHPYRDQ